MIQIAMTDREKVIKELHDARRYLEDKEWSDRGASPHIDAINDALAILKEQETGHWIFLTDCSNSGVYCSECNTKVFDSYPFKKKFSYFCPHCGTRMEGEIERR